jgi:hypothetical protein
MKELVDRVRAPLNEYEAREKRRVEGHEAALKEIEAVFITLPAGVAPDEIRERVAQVENWPLRDWEEFRARAERETNVTLGLLHRALGAAAKREEDEREAEAEAERQRLAAIEAQRQREEQIAADAAEQARIAAEERAAREAREAQERADTALREAEARARAERDAAARALADATERERVAEEQRVAGHRAALDNLAALANDWPEGLGLQGMEIRLAHANQMVTRDWQEFAMQAAAVHADAVRLIEGHIAIERENIRVANEIAEETRVENERKRAEAEAAEAVEAERLRVAREKATQQAEDDRRAANKAHRARINNMVMAGLVALGGCIDEDVAKKIIIAVAKGEVHHMRIDYAADVKAGALL